MEIIGNVHNSIPRRIRTFGIFSKRHWFGIKPDGSNLSWFYYKLKNIGFKETIWQFVYKGQIAGLILPLENGRKELHVRFYRNDVVEAELEIGRHYLTHFVAPRCQGERFVLQLLEPYLSASERKIAEKLLRKDETPLLSIPLPSHAKLRYSYLTLAIAAVLMMFVGIDLLPKEAIGIIIIVSGIFIKSLPTIV